MKLALSMLLAFNSLAMSAQMCYESGQVQLVDGAGFYRFIEKTELRKREIPLCVATDADATEAVMLTIKTGTLEIRGHKADRVDFLCVTHATCRNRRLRANRTLSAHP